MPAPRKAERRVARQPRVVIPHAPHLIEQQRARRVDLVRVQPRAQQEIGDEREERVGPVGEHGAGHDDVLAGHLHVEICAEHVQRPAEGGVVAFAGAPRGGTPEQLGHPLGARRVLSRATVDDRADVHEPRSGP